MTIEEFIGALNFEENDYRYHVTGHGNGEKILEEGLFVDGYNILGVNNILETTTLPLTMDIVSSSENFTQFLEEELSNKGFRDASEMVILGYDKSFMSQIVNEFDSFKDDVYYEGHIPTEFIMGYFTKDTLDFNMNENYNYDTDDFGTLSSL